MGYYSAIFWKNDFLDLFPIPVEIENILPSNGGATPSGPDSVTLYSIRCRPFGDMVSPFGKKSASFGRTDSMFYPNRWYVLGKQMVCFT